MTEPIEQIKSRLAAGEPPGDDVLALFAGLMREPGLDAPRLAELPGLWRALLEASGRDGMRGRLSGMLMAPAAPLPVKTATSRAGMVSCGSPHAIAAGMGILREGGNAVDAAVAGCFAMAVADPPNTSLFGRGHLLIAQGGTVTALDGATQVPRDAPPVPPDAPRPTGFAVVPLPGLPKTLLHALERFGTLPLERALAPAIALAEQGFSVPPHAASIWARKAEELRKDPWAARCYLKPDGAPWQTGERFRHPLLAGLLRRLAHEGAEMLEGGPFPEQVAAAVRAAGGWWTAAELAEYQPLEADVVRGRYAGWEVYSNGGSAWGHTLVEMVNVLDACGLPGRGWGVEPYGLLALAILTGLRDRPQELSTLRPKPDGLPLGTLTEPAFARRRAEGLRALLRDGDARLAGFISGTDLGSDKEDRDTAHISVVDTRGDAVSLTCSIGPHFGTAVALPEYGVLLPNSYRMADGPEPGQRDQTELTPALLHGPGGETLAIGGAGSERIPGAVAQVIAHLVSGGMPLAEALAEPRLTWKNGKLRVHCDLPPAVLEGLEGLGFPLELRNRSHVDHLGVVHAVLRLPDGSCEGAADPTYDGGWFSDRD